jgi:S1-C subfamily serine protease
VFTLFVFCILFSFTEDAWSRPAPEPRGTQESEADFLVRRAREAHQFSVYIQNYVGDQIEISKISGGAGTGFIYSIDRDRNVGYIITNEHVVSAQPDEAQAVVVSFQATPEGRTFRQSVRVVAKSRVLDFAILEFKPSDLPNVNELAEAPITRDVAQLRRLIQTGRPVAAFGHPDGARNNFTKGVISEARNSQFGMGFLIKTDAAINPGNSGGSLVELDSGLLVGMNTLKLNGSDNSGFAISIEDVLKEADLFFNGKTNLRDGFLHLDTQPLPWKALQGSVTIGVVPAEHRKKFEGLFAVVETDAGSPLAKGDIILSVDQHPIGLVRGAKSEGIVGSPSLESIIATSPGKTLDFTVIRDAKVIQVPVSIGDLTAADEARANEFQLVSGIFLQDVHPDERRQFASYGTGVVVTRIRDGSIGASLMERGLISKGSLVTHISHKGQNHKVTSVADVNRIFENVSEGDLLSFQAMVPGVQGLLSKEPIVVQVGMQSKMVIFQAQQMENGKSLSLAEVRARFPWNYFGIDIPQMGSQQQTSDTSFTLPPRPLPCALLLKQVVT